jgi:dienelactone hydrolase
MISNRSLIGGIAMRNLRKMIARKEWVALVIAIMIVGAALGQAQRQPGGGPQRDQRGGPLKKARPEAGDPLAKVAGIVQKPTSDLSHYTFRLRSFDGTPLAASYYPSRLGNSAPVIMLIHEMGRSRKDFEDPIQELKGQGLAVHLQGLGYAVFSMDLRWQGQNPRRALNADERPKLLEDLQAGYFFLVDRHNRGDLNLEKLGIIALGDGANLATAWATQPGAGVTIEGKPSDVSALTLISPNPEGFGHILGHGLMALAPRVPLLLVAGERDNASKDAVQSVRQAVQRVRLSKIELFPSALHGYKLLRLEPKITLALFRFLETTLKNRPVEWEPKYNLTPVTFGDSQLVKNDRQAENTKNNAKNVLKNPQKKAEVPGKIKVEKAEPKQQEQNIPPQSPQPGPRDNVD